MHSIARVRVCQDVSLAQFNVEFLIKRQLRLQSRIQREAEAQEDNEDEGE